LIYDDLEYVEEADIFANQMKNVKTLHPVEIFKANCEAGNEKDLFLHDYIETGHGRNPCPVFIDRGKLFPKAAGFIRP
jgi:hypothetical protein